VALLDGDDYWTSPQKLQRQVDFLDAHPECALCFHNALVVDEAHGRPPHRWTPDHQKEISTLDELWYGNFIATCSTMYRNGLVAATSMQPRAVCGGVSRAARPASRRSSSSPRCGSGCNGGGSRGRRSTAKRRRAEPDGDDGLPRHGRSALRSVGERRPGGQLE